MRNRSRSVLARRAPTTGLLVVAGMAACLLVPSSARAAGFALFEQSARGLGSAFAGEAAAAEDPSTMYYNAAGLGWVPGTQFTSSGFAIIPSANFTNHGSALNPVLGGEPIRGGNGGDAGVLGLVPTFFLAHELGEGFHVGLGVSVPFGLSTEYERGWVGRYGALSSRLETTNVNPTIAWRPLDWFAIGFGADVEYAKARLTNALDLGGICEIFGPRTGVPAAVCPAIGFAPQSKDGAVKISGDDWGGGWNVGLMFAPWRTTRIGLSYRSNIEHQIHGNAEFFLPKGAGVLRRASGALVNTPGSADLNLPDRASMAIYHELTPTLTALVDATWTHWSRFDQLVFRFANPKQPPIVEPENWNDSFRFALGFRWKATRTLQLRIGTAFDQSPVPSARYRTPRIPDSDRVWLASGIAWAPTDQLRVDVGYAHLFAFDVPIRNPDPVTGNVVRGNYSAEADIVGVQLTYRFGWPLLGTWVE